MPNVWNIKNPNCPKDAIYVGRANARYKLKESKWHNPFRIGGFLAGRTLDREDCIMLYRNYLYNSNAGKMLLEYIGQLTGKDLSCWCAPEPCHADILLEIANRSGQEAVQR